jgi:hypothetical protein
VALSGAQLKSWMAADLSKLDLLVIQIDGIHIEQDLILLAAVGIDGEGNKRPLVVLEGATENAAMVQACWVGLPGRASDGMVGLDVGRDERLQAAATVIEGMARRRSRGAGNRCSAEGALRRW